MFTIGGGEIVALYLCRELKADLYTTNIDRDSIIKMGFEDIINNIYSIGKIPKLAPFKPQLAFYRFRKLNLKNKYDYYIIAGDWAMSGAVNNKPNIWYAHTPLNEIWEFKDFIKKYMLKKWQKPFYNIWCYINRKLTLKYSKHINIWTCASDIVKDRIRRFYKKESQIIYPPIDTKIYNTENIIKDNYWLSVNRFAQNKRVELQIQAFSQLPNEKLIMIYDFDNGSKELVDYKNIILKSAEQYKNIQFIHEPEKIELINIYKKAKAFITTSLGESFGMTVVEAMSAGLPIVAPNDGGYKYTVKNNENGILIDNINSDKIIQAINEINKKLSDNSLTYHEKNTQAAKKYDISEFIRKIKENMI